MSCEPINLSKYGVFTNYGPQKHQQNSAPQRQTLDDLNSARGLSSRLGIAISLLLSF
jgi:hypothetical protein